jgi:hypothetical protein
MSSATGLGAQPPEKEQLEILKLKAEAEKILAERDKVVEEFRQSKGLFARLGKVFTPVVAALTIIFGYLAATHSQRVAEAELKVTKAELEKQRLEGAAATAEHDLTEAKAKLADTNEKIAVANAARAKAEAAEKGTQNRLSGLQKEYANLQNEQTQRITLGNLRKLIDILDSEPPERQVADSRYVEDIRKEVADDGGFRTARLRYLTDAAQNNNHRPALRGLLYYSLFQVTDDNQWLDQIRRQASQNLLLAWPTYSSLMRLKYFDSKDRADAMCSSYAEYMRQNPAFEGAEGMRVQLLGLDRPALLRCRKPFLDHLQYWRSKSDTAFNRLAFVGLGSRSELPLQGVVIWYLKAHPDFSPRHATGEELAILPFYLQGINASDDFVQMIRASNSAQEWMEKHKKLVDAWASPDFHNFAISSDGTMNKILSGIWVTEADLP